MDTDEAGEVSLEPEGTADDMQICCAYLTKCNTLFIRWDYTLKCERAFRMVFGDSLGIACLYRNNGASFTSP